MTLINSTRPGLGSLELIGFATAYGPSCSAKSARLTPSGHRVVSTAVGTGPLNFLASKLSHGVELNSRRGSRYSIPRKLHRSAGVLVGSLEGQIGTLETAVGGLEARVFILNEELTASRRAANSWQLYTFMFLVAGIASGYFLKQLPGPRRVRQGSVPPYD